MNKFEIGQEVFVIYRIKNKKGVHKWKSTEKSLKIVDKNCKYYFNKKPFKARKNQVFSTYKEAENRCYYLNHWGKFHDKNGNKVNCKNKNKRKR